MSIGMGACPNNILHQQMTPLSSMLTVWAGEGHGATYQIK